MTEILLATLNDVGASGVSSFNTRTGDVTLAAADVGGAVAVAQVSHQWLQALGSDGTWTQSQPAFSDISGTVAASQLPLATTSAFGAVKPDGTTITISSGVISASGTSSGVSSFNTRTGAVTLTAADVGAQIGVSAVSHQFLTALSAAGSFSQAQPAFTDISGTVAASQLPNPSSSTLGGVKSLAAVSHNFLTSITTAGLPVAAQPAFTDISGSVAASQLPNPAATTLGGVKSATASTHQFMTGISTAGAPTFAQPATTDISGFVDTTPVGILCIIDGGGATPATGLWKAYFPVPYAGTITKVTALADQSGSISLDVLKTTFSSFDAGGTHPVDGDKISASAPVAISSSTKYQDSTLTGWTTSVSAGDIIAFNVNSVTSIQRVTVMLNLTRS